MAESLKNKILKLIIAFFLILNILVIAFGYSFLSEENLKISTEIKSKELLLDRTKKSLLEEVQILNASIEDKYSNLAQIKTNINEMQVRINDSSSSFESLDQEKLYYQNKLNSLQIENSNLDSQKNNLQNQVQAMQQQLKMQQAMAAAAVKRRTRSS